MLKVAKGEMTQHRHDGQGVRYPPHESLTQLAGSQSPNATGERRPT